ncbi:MULTISPECIES: RNA polymerase sigma factor [unclassified Novosphingobium]|jgi:RNA polymerase sigma-70 factor (ECF subfamily)|uniref:RNA polymerase sigma factor n=1 Tax=unclassified Novosphingobium TaxID=2644732 RepID=UPI00086A6F3F|nr:MULTISPECIES: sigma-70 family RNA polymerase sigma factor [unclassified Novosphingobium]MBN9145670.1 sigma-70 family RNA polymerase sigma factor [Novosphingobium sp.]ODU80724.1 MAG: RNA polymerase subunit sigma-24 [Novosphingobium sp. SCN 63-17]OJX87874.1 MAG: RNA polymerase subunit sigma-24 [Novosphingobium sp. 63-713]
MRAIRSILAGLSPRLTEGVPLPPDDRVVKASALALEDIYRREAPRMIRAMARLSSSQDAEDIVHDSFVQLARAGSDRTIEQPEAYLNRIASNLQCNRAKSAFERARALSTPVEDVVLSGPDPTAQLEARDMIHRIQNALMRLSPKTRDIFLSHRVDGLSYGEIADGMGLSVKGIEWHMTKAIAHLDRSLRTR